MARSKKKTNAKPKGQGGDNFQDVKSLFDIMNQKMEGSQQLDVMTLVKFTDIRPLTQQGVNRMEAQLLIPDVTDRVNWNFAFNILVRKMPKEAWKKGKDGELIEVFGVIDGWHRASVIAEAIKTKRLDASIRVLTIVHFVIGRTQQRH